MTNGIDKKALFKFKSEPYLKPISDLGVGFYNLDENTAILRFQLSNSQGPLLLHENNLKAYAYFESSNGSASDVIELEIEDSYNGIVTITLDKEFLQASTSTSVTGQVYIAVNNVDRKEKNNEVAVFREFTFTVKDALINKISSFTKVEYIRMFDKLKMHIEQRIKDIEEAIKNGEDYVAEMKMTLKNGLEEINNTVTEAVETVNKISEDASNKINETKDDAVTTVNKSRDEVLNAINDNEVVRKTEMSGYFDEQDWQKYKLTEDNGNITTLSDTIDMNTLEQLDKTGFYYCSNLINTPDEKSKYGYINVYKQGKDYGYAIYRDYNSSDLYINMKYNAKWNGWKLLNRDYEKDLNWQKYKFTEDDGTIKYISKGSITDVKTLPPGFYETVSDDDASSQDIPLDNSYVQIKVWEANEGRKEIELTSTYNNKKYFRLLHTNGDRDSGWIEVGPTQGDTGWVPFNLINGAKTNSSYDYGGSRNGFGCAYRTIKRGNVTERHLRINGSNVKHDQVIAKLPSNFCKNVQIGFVRAPLAHNGTSIIVETNGQVKVYVANETEWSSDDGHYLYGEISWLD